MTPLALNAALLACLGAGVVDLTLLNLAVVPELYPATPTHQADSARQVAARGPEREPGPTKPAAQLAHTVTAPEGTSREASGGERPTGLTLIAVLEFETSSRHVDGKARFRIRQQLQALRDAPRIVIVGHTDESGPEAFNDRLSHERAEAALRQLLARAIPAERIELVARGEREPLAHGNSRRVEIYRGGQP